MTYLLSENELQNLSDMANKLRIHSIEMTNESNSGHPTSCSSIAEIMSVLFFKIIKSNINNPRDINSDRFILSKGHAAPILYAVWAELGLFPTVKLKTLRKIDSDLEGHPTPKLPFVDVATGSLGQGLGCACGMAYSAKYIHNQSLRVFCVIGDAELMEGSNWEAAAFASHYQLDNLVAIVDVNRLGQSDPTMHGHDMNLYKKKWDAFGFHVFVVDGHDISELYKSLSYAQDTKSKPVAILAKTFKGHNFPGISDNVSWHGKPLGIKASEVIQFLNEKIINKNINVSLFNLPKVPQEKEYLGNITLDLPHLTTYKSDEKIATRLAYGNALALIGNNPLVVACDADVKNSTFSDKFAKLHSKRFVDLFIAEQNMVSVAQGIAARNQNVVFVSTFAAFLTRAFDQIRMGIISHSEVNYCGSHCGVSIGEDGPSQMALEDLGMFRSLPGSVVFYPSDAVSTERAVHLAANYKGCTYIRTSRPNLPILYESQEKFEIGKSKVIRKSASDKVLVIGAAVTLYEALKAYETLKGQNINIRVMDLFTIKPIDKDSIKLNASECSNNILVVEDHYKEGGIGEAVSLELLKNREAYNLKHLYIISVPMSGKPEELLVNFRIDSVSIVNAVKELIS